MKAVALILFVLLGSCLNLFGQSDILSVYENGSTRVKRKVLLPEVIFFKLKSENKLVKYRGELIDVKDDTLYIERGVSPLIRVNFDTPAVYLQKIAWNDIKWIQFRRNLIGSIVYDYIAIYPYLYTIGGTAIMIFAGIEPLYFTQRTFDSDAFAIGMGVALVSLPFSALAHSLRFREYKPTLHTLKAH